MKHRIICFFIVAVLLFTFTTPAFAGRIADINDVRKNMIFEKMVDSWEENYSISQIRKITDFANNPYIVVECDPTGYIIFNENAGVVMEYSKTSVSPYYNITGNGFYCGPTQYFYFDKTEEKFIHTISGSIICETSISDYISVSNSAQAELMEVANTELLEYIYRGTGNIFDTVSLNSTETFVGDHESFFTNLNTATKMGYWSTGNGVCGYVASGIVLLYYDYYVNDDFILDSVYLNSAGNAFNGNSFTRHLYNDIGVGELGYGTAISSGMAANVMETYLDNERNIDISCWKAIPANVDDIIYQIRYRDMPVIYVDRLNSPQSSGGTVDHDVVVYGFDSNNHLIAHFGWVGYEQVVCSSPALAVFVSNACGISYIY